MQTSTENNLKIYKYIKETADKISNASDVYTRADIAFELKGFGITSDSDMVSRLVYEAYIYYKNDKAIRQSFINNAGTQNLVDEYEIRAVLAGNEKNAVIQYVDARLDNAGKALEALSALSEKAITARYSDNSGLMEKVTGTSQIKALSGVASRLYGKYSDLVEAYSGARADVKNVIGDFVSLRNDVQRIYSRYSACLVDIFGDSVKVVAPEIFDFDSVEFLDVEKMLGQVKLEYDTLAQNCSTLIGEISADFSESLKLSATNYRMAGNSRGLGLAMAGMTMLNHYLEAQEKANKCRAELELFKKNIRHDSTLIKSDHGRLAVIYRTLNDVSVPKARVFYRYAGDLMSSDLEKFLSLLYSQPEVKKLVAERDIVLEQINSLQDSISDAELNIAGYKNSIEKAKAFLKAEESAYRQARECKPGKPMAVKNIITLGSAARNYNREIYEWNVVYYPLIKEYEVYSTNINLDREEVKTLQENLKSMNSEYKTLKKRLKKMNADIAAKISVSGEDKIAAARYLESVVGMLAVAKSILETKLDDRLTETVKIDAERDLKLDRTVQDNITRFSSALRDAINENRLPPSEETTPEEQILDNSAYDAINKCVNLIESGMQLKALKEAGRAENHKYELHMKKMKEEFRKYMDEIDRDNAALAETIRRINTAGSPEELREMLLTLSDGRIQFSEKDIDDLLKGNKQIEI